MRARDSKADMRKLHELPRFADRWAYLYFEMGQVDKDADGLYFHNAQGKVPVPIDQLSLIMLGPGTSITHAAVNVLAKNNCLLAWVGQDGIRLYAHSTGGTFSAKRTLVQASLVSNNKSRMKVARRMYQFRFESKIPDDLRIEEIRGLEGRRVRDTYFALAQEYNLEWSGRRYNQNEWNKADPLNRAMSAANSCLYGICHAAIVSAGFSAAIGFIHTGKMLSFVYDIADLYKTDLSLPVAFKVASEKPEHLERAVREACRFEFHMSRIMERIIPDIMEVLGVGDSLRESPAEFEGKIVTLADRAENGDLPGESDSQGEGGTTEKD